MDNLTEIHTNKIRLAVALNTAISIILGFIVYYYLLNDLSFSSISTLVFVGLASLTVPHMLLKAIINYKALFFK